jgi:hypothetical protein
MFLFLASLNISQKRRKEENETHTGLICNSNRTYSRRTNRKQNKTKKTQKNAEKTDKEIWPPQKKQKKPKNIQRTLSYYHGSGSVGFNVKRPWYVFCSWATEPPSAAAIAGREKKGKEEGPVWGGWWLRRWRLLRAGRNTGIISGRNE